MSLFIHIIRDKKNPSQLEIDSEAYDYEGATVKNFSQTDEYNTLFSKIIYQNRDKIKYLVSETLIRAEGRTYFYDKLSKYIYLINLIKKHKCNIRINNLDYLIFKGIKKYLEERKVNFKYNHFSLFLYDAKKIFNFILKAFLKCVLDIIVFSISKLYLTPFRINNYSYIFLSFYDSRCIRDGNYKDAYFQPLIEYMKSKQKNFFVFSTLLINEKPWKFNKYIATLIKFLKDIKYLQKNNKIILYNQLISFFDLLKAYFKGLRGYIKLHRKVVYQGHDISYLINLSLREDYFRCYWTYEYQQYYFFKSIFKQLDFNEILFPYENHPWERLIILARNQVKASTRLVGFQHTSISFKLLQHFPGKYEKNLPVYPDRILTVGNILKDVMNNYGYYKPGLIDSGCALRHPYLFTDDRPKERRGFTKKIAYAFSFDIRVYPIVLNSLIDVFSNSQYTIYLKIHPIVPQDHVIKRRLPDNIIPAKYMDWQDLFKEIDLLFYDDNSLGIEALKYNLDVVHFSLANKIYNSDRLFNYDRIKFTVNSLDELRTFINDYYEGKFCGDGDSDYKRQYLYQYFLPITDERMEKFLIRA